MPIQFAALQSETLEHLGIDATDLDASGSNNLNLLINRSWWDIVDRFDFKEKEKSALFATADGQRDYPLQTIIGSDIFESIREVAIKDLNDLTHSALEPISLGWYESNYGEQDTLETKPTSYFHEGTNLRLFPTPDQAYTITLYYKYILTDLSAANPNIPQAWHEIILYGAIARGFRRARDLSSAREYESLQEVEFGKRSTTTAKEDRDIKFAGVQVYKNAYSTSPTGRSNTNNPWRKAP